MRARGRRRRARARAHPAGAAYAPAARARRLADTRLWARRQPASRARAATSHARTHAPPPPPPPTCRFCDWPQELGLELTDGLCTVTQLQLLSHQSKIATRIELYVGAGDDYRRCEFVRLGYLSLDGNEASGYKARELKSVYIKARGNFVKLLLHRCYVNAPNLFNQVGLVAVNVLGGGGPAAEGRAHAAEPAAARRCVYEGGGGAGAAQPFTCA